MTSEQAKAIRSAVDAGGWNAVRVNKVLNEVWKQALKESREYVNKYVDR